MVIKVKLDSLGSRYRSRPLRLVSRLSFEQRALVFPRQLVGCDVEGTAFASKDGSALAARSIDDFKLLLPHVTISELDNSNPIGTANTILSVLRTANKASKSRQLVIDTSSFRREELLILIACLKLLQAEDASTELVYVSAENMAQDWMTRNAIAHRSVIGYAGEIKPSRNTKLVIMMGFEVERARSIIENYEPSEVLIGMAGQADSINDILHHRNKQFFEDLKRQFKGVTKIFEFSARDPIKTAADLEKAVGIDTSSNILLAPLNTKISTIGAGLFGLSNRRVQLVYAQMNEYNEASYSTVGSDAYVMPINTLPITSMS